MDYKTAYSQSVTLSKEMTKEEADLQKKISSGESRKNTYRENWKSVNINDVVERFTPGGDPIRINGKIVYSSNEGKYEVIADIGGGYLRIKNLRTNEYIGVNGQSMHNYTDANGKQHGRSKADFNSVTHFRIKKKEEM